MYANGGDCLDCASGDSVDRIAFLTPLFGHVFAFAFDYSATLEDSKTFSRPWSMHFRLHRNPDSHEHLMEFKCVPFTEDLLYGEFYKRATK